MTSDLRVTPDLVTGGVWVLYQRIDEELLRRIVAYASSVRRGPTGWLATVKSVPRTEAIMLRIFPARALATVMAEDTRWSEYHYPF